ncbi:MAG: alpha,alpha-trehalose-phosphate synthase (UDP-forming) [Limibacillus sp.]|jgi:trehalose 6-phosphate synthase
MSRLIVVSNRVADLEKGAQSGGLAVALGDALKKAQGLWFGWDGNILNGGRLATNVREQAGVTFATTPLTREEYEQYYLGYSNNVLWPTFHYRIDLTNFETAFVQGYRKVNQRMAQALAPLVTEGDTVWVHDYHLIPLAAELRTRGIEVPIGFFLHIPFPPPEILQTIPDHEWLVRSLFSCDVIGFQTSGDRGNFARYVRERAGGEETEGGRLKAFGRTVIAKAYPIGIDVEDFAAMAHAKQAEELIERMHRRSFERSLIIGVDRLDYTKGLPERLKAFRRLLELYPENRRQATLLQIAPPTREEVEAYTEIREELEGLTGAINGAFGNFDWTPVRYIHRAVPRDTLAALFRGSQVGLVTPLRDGMNLVAKEYVAAQDSEDPGVLVLSEFAGAAEDLIEALIVNPYDVDDMAAALQRAVTMPLEERRERHAKLMERVRTNDVIHWRERFLGDLYES